MSTTKLSLKASRPSLHWNWRLKYGGVAGTQKGRTYGLGSRNNPQRLQAGLRGEGTSRWGEGVDVVQVTAMTQLNQQLAAAEARRLEGERVMQESMKSLQAQVLSHIACGRLGVPHSPPPPLMMLISSRETVNIYDDVSTLMSLRPRAPRHSDLGNQIWQELVGVGDSCKAPTNRLNLRRHFSPNTDSPPLSGVFNLKGSGSGRVLRIPARNE
ncbi:hypothetical protein RND71_015748 [Anisodus tanguticus]|uniref:Uncharacterized protein n=1 Tax=Anisodus tanguticus TaxID=243964 RepID=A0AAE1VLD7_9SOLA|nr:hypothetical protein RND71_015748 [Anisodus tanguticus]